MPVRSVKRKDVGRWKANRRAELNARRINRKKYYGLGVEIDKFKDVLEHHFTHSSVIDNLSDSIGQVETVSEDVASDVANRSSLLREDMDAVLDDLEEPLNDSYDKGSRRAFDSNGDQLERPANFEAQVQQILREQENYISKLDQDLRQKAMEVIRAGVAAGLAKTQIIDNLRTELKNLIDNRSSTIANSEVVKAGVAGTVATFQANGVSEVTWVSAQDHNVCRPGNFRITLNGKTFTSCRELHGESFELPRFPRPVLESHANCRCVLVSNNDN